MSNTVEALTKLSEAVDLAPGLFGSLATIAVAITGGAFWFGKVLEASEKKALVAQSAFLTLQLNETKEKAARTTQDLATLKAQIEELKAKDPGVGRQLDASIERAQTSNNSVTDTISAAAKYVVEIFG
ncbi:hypothetical protein [Bradyrhizobium sp. 21]|uniref:hypothetical protein n=1 Tax=Bradyrhizobium sp. 21 TaxID=2782666 RepID=UPI001FFA346C|nr:hypothetical protein [Bradyrhizobium sp. 21]MCK1386542.1 hypothetical protein [Bradyrhizobium sp. 21]